MKLCHQMLIVQELAAVEEDVIHKVTLPGKNTNYLVLKSEKLSKLSRSRWGLKNHMWRFDLQREDGTGVSSGNDSSSLLLMSHSRTWEMQLPGPPLTSRLLNHKQFNFSQCSDSVCFKSQRHETSALSTQL